MVFLSRVITISSDISLKLFAEDDAEDLYQIIKANAEEFVKTLQWIDKCSSLESTKDNIQKNLNKANNLDYGIWQTNKLVGGFRITSDDSNHSFKFGYWKDNAGGKGLITKICVYFITRLFGSDKYNRAEIQCAVENKKSCKIAQELGFTFEGVLREVEFLYDHYVNHKVYSMLKKEWPKSLEQYLKKYPEDASII